MSQVISRIKEIDKAIGRAIKHVRVHCGVSQIELGNLLGCTFQQIQKYEKGINRVSAGKLSVIAEFLNKPVSYFFDPKVNKVFFETKENTQGIKLIKDYLKIKDPKMRSQIRALVKVASNNN